MLGIKFLIARSPDPEIYFPAGTELILQLTAEADIPAPFHAANREASNIAPLSAAELANAQRVLASLPQQRTDRGHNHPSDLVNILFLGSRESINRVFQAAGWTGAQRSSIRSIYRMYHCMVQRMGYSMAPMGKLTLNGVTASAEYQKSLNTFSKRHHVRLWKQGQEDAWLGAATEDVSYKFQKMHLTHATDPLIDNERTKVLNDVAFTGCLEAATVMARDSSAHLDQERFINTDGRIAVLRINDCQNPRTMPSEGTQTGPRGRRRSVQALIALRNDLIRTNPVSLAYNTIAALRRNRDSQGNGSMSAFSSKRLKSGSAGGGVQSTWIRPSVLDATTAANDHP
jgi:LssY C-terminus